MPPVGQKLITDTTKGHVADARRKGREKYEKKKRIKKYAEDADFYGKTTKKSRKPYA
jgi:hypothetical protein